jgi:hypothetical protein
MYVEKTIRGFAIAIIVLFAVEGLSWFTAPVPPCLIVDDSRQPTANSAEHKDCPTFFAGMQIIGRRAADFIKRDDNDKVIVAAFTVVLALSTIGLWLAAIQLWRSTQKLWEAGERQIENNRAAAEQQNSALVVSNNVARMAALGAQESAKASVRQAELAESALVQLERPYIFVFGANRFWLDEAAKAFFIEYTVANYGKMPAIVEQPLISFVIDNRAQPQAPLLAEASHGLIVSPILEGGETRKFKAYLPQGMREQGVSIEVAEGMSASGEPTGQLYPSIIQSTGYELFFRAVISYRGPFSSGHTSAALWWLDSSAGEFVVRGGEKYNYVK